MTRARRHNERGAALLLVLWVFMILGVIALDFSRYMRDDATAAINFAEETQGYYLALAGMNRALYDAEREREDQVQTSPQGRAAGSDDELDDDEVPALVPTDGQWHEGDFAGGRWSVRMTDEGGRIALNRASEGVLTRVITYLLQGGKVTAGQDRRAVAEVGTIVDSILDWVDIDDLTRLHGAENKYYQGLRIPYDAKNGYFDSPEELLKVRGVTPQLFIGGDGLPGLRDIFSVYSRSRTVNVRNAPPAVLQVMLGLDAEEIADLLAQRDEQGVPLLPLVQAILTPIDPGLVEMLVDQPPQMVYVEARGDARHARNQSRVAMVADLASDVAEGVRVLRWLDRAPWTGTFLVGTTANGAGA